MRKIQWLPLVGYVEFSEEGLESLIKHFTSEAGLRNLERKIGAAENDVNSVQREINRYDSRIQTLNYERNEAFEQLAKLFLPEMSQDVVMSTISGMKSEVKQIFKEKQDLEPVSRGELPETREKGALSVCVQDDQLPVASGSNFGSRGNDIDSKLHRLQQSRVSIKFRSHLLSSAMSGVSAEAQLRPERKLTTFICNARSSSQQPM